MDLTSTKNDRPERMNLQRYPADISSGFTPAERPVIAAMYWDAFGKKLGRVMGPDHRATGLLWLGWQRMARRTTGAP